MFRAMHQQPLTVLLHAALSLQGSLGPAAWGENWPACMRSNLGDGALQSLCWRTLSACKATPVGGMVYQKITLQLAAWADNYPDASSRYASALARRSHCEKPHQHSTGIQCVTKPIW